MVQRLEGRDVLGHLVHHARSLASSMVRELIRHPIRPDRRLDLIARQLGDEPVPAVAQRLREAQHGGVHVIGFPAAVGLETSCPPDTTLFVLSAWSLESIQTTRWRS